VLNKRISTSLYSVFFSYHPSRSPFSHLTSRLKISNRSYYPSAPVLWNNFPSAQRCSSCHSLNTPVFYLSTSFFLKKSKIYFFLLSLHSPVGFLRTYFSGIDQASLFHHILISLSFTTGGSRGQSGHAPDCSLAMPHLKCPLPLIKS